MLINLISENLSSLFAVNCFDKTFCGCQWLSLPQRRWYLQSWYSKSYNSMEVIHGVYGDECLWPISHLGRVGQSVKLLTYLLYLGLVYGVN